MHDRAESENSSLGLTERLAWVAGLSALAGLLAEVVRRSRHESSLSLIGGLLIVYVVYIACSVRFFWRMPRIAVPTTLLIEAALWTLSLRFIERSDVIRGLISLLFIPLITAHAVWLIFPEKEDTGDVNQGPMMPSLVHSLLEKGKGFGSRSGR